MLVDGGAFRGEQQWRMGWIACSRFCVFFHSVTLTLLSFVIVLIETNITSRKTTKKKKKGKISAFISCTKLLEVIQKVRLH